MKALGSMYWLAGNTLVVIPQLFTLCIYIYIEIMQISIHFNLSIVSLQIRNTDTYYKC